MPDHAQVIVGSASGLHARPAALFVAAAAKQPVPVTIRTRRQERRAGPQHARASCPSARKQGTEVTLEADGDGAEAARRRPSPTCWHATWTTSPSMR